MKKWLVATAVLAALLTLSTSIGIEPLQWIPMGEDSSVTLPPGDDAAMEVLTPIGFTIGDTLHHNIYVVTNGLISFGAPYTSFFNQVFPGGVANLYLIAPFWDDVNTVDGGTISYEIHTSGDTLELVSEYIRDQTNTDFEGYWMMVVFWDSVRPYSFFTTTSEENSFQAILITDGEQNTYTIFIYECGLMQWDNTATIGYNAGPDHHDNHDPSSSDIACANSETNNFTNVYYRLHEAEPLPIEPAQSTYLDFIPHTTTAINGGNLEGCDDCVTPEINLPGDFPFGNYNHQTAFLGSNGIISLRNEYTHFDAELFPTTNPNIYWGFVAAPFWSDVDLRLEGRASWEIHSKEQSQDLIDTVSTFIQLNIGDAIDFSGEWMMIGYWEKVHPFPHGSGSTDPYVQNNNTYQAILITDGTKSYAVYTYKCGEMQWGDESTIGFNAGADYYENHPITGHFQSHFISCLQNNTNGNLIKNQIYDLVPDPTSLIPNVIPPFHSTIGSCYAAGFTECCNEGDCRGLPLAGSCYCDSLCSARGDCCYDQQHLCPTGLLIDDYLIVAEDTSILHMSLNGSDLESLHNDVNGRAYGIDYHFANGFMVWSDIEKNIIYGKYLNGTGLVTELVTTNIAAVDDVAIDWIGNNLYWTDAVWARIEVMSLDSLDRAELLRTGTNTNPRAIAVDPTTRYMYWTELGENVKIERAFMDGDGRQVLLGFGLIQPNGITIDIAEQRLYWCDTMLDTIAFADVGTSGIQNLGELSLESGTVVMPFSLALSATSVFWSDWNTNAVYSTHKLYGSDNEASHLATVYSGSGTTPRGLEVVSSSQQPTDGITNPCAGSGCSHICMLSGSSDGFTCACPENHVLNSNGLTCEMVSTPSPTPPPEGSCTIAGYTTCCSHGSCGGNPATCFCDSECYTRFDCCDDLQSICNEVAPLQPVDIEYVFTQTVASVSFTIPFVVHDIEEYQINYGTSMDTLDQSSSIQTSAGSGENIQYTIQISNLSPGVIYYFQVALTNSISTTFSGVFSGTTLEAEPTGYPQDFDLTVDDNALMLSWQPPLPEERNGVIISYTLICGGTEIKLNAVTQLTLYLYDEFSPNAEITCSIVASTAAGEGPSDEQTVTVGDFENGLMYLGWLQMGALYETSQEFLPSTDDGFDGPIPIPTPGFIFGTSAQTQVFVGTNGLISFGSGYNSFANQEFPGNAAISSLYLVAPFWDDVDIRFNTGDISYEVHQSGYFLDYVNAYIQTTKPTSFVGTWMMVVYYDAVHPYFGLFSQEENTFQVILITNGTYSYTIFTYQCGLMEWDNGATIGFNAGGEFFANHEPSTSDVACLNEEDSVWSNVIYLLSSSNPESPSPSNVEAVDTTLNSTTIQWVVSAITTQQQYTVQYGTDPNNLSTSTDSITSTDDTSATDLMFAQSLDGLEQGTTYYVQVVSTFDSYTLTSNVISFTTLEPVPGEAPLNFTIVGSGTSLTFTWTRPVGNEVIASYMLFCSSNTNPIFIEVKNIITLTLYDLAPETTYFCTLAAASSSGYGPSTQTVNATTGDAIEADSYFSFVPMDIHVGVNQLFFPETDDGIIGPISIPGGFPFGNSVQNEVYIGSNGILSFGSGYNPFINELLPVPDVYLVAPYWDDVDIRFGSGQISYEIHEYGYFLDEVSEFIRRRRSAILFQGRWMLVVYWDAVHPYFGFFSDQENTFQAILITDGTYSYTLFTYNCALTEWDNGVTIGFSDGSEMFSTFDPSTSEVACLNQPASNFSNVIYLLSSASPEIPPPEMVTLTNITMTGVVVTWTIPSFLGMEEYTVEYGKSTAALDLVSTPVQSIEDTTTNFEHYSIALQELSAGTQYYLRVVARFGTGDIYVRSSDIFSFFTQFEPQAAYLPFLEHTNTSIHSGTLLSCDDCSSLEIILPSDFPFGGYIHQTAFVSTNGLITFGSFITTSDPVVFPPTDSDTFWTYIVAPFWADFDTSTLGTVSWEIHDRQNSPALVSMVDNFIGDENGDEIFEGSWMLVAFWENMKPSELTAGSTFQAILTTNGTKSYSVFTYHCGDLEWSDVATIGFNAPPTDALTHPLSTGLAGAANIRTDEIACLYDGSEWSNLIYELEDGNHILGTTPEPHFAAGSCAEAGYTECCTGVACLIQPGFCFCDSDCRIFGDCCYDIDETCPPTDGSVYDILVGHGDHISQIHFEGTSSETVRTNTAGTVAGVDYLFSNSSMFWSDLTTDTINRANLDGSEEEVLVDSCISTVDDIAVDWVSNKLYWADAVWARIEALDLDSGVRVEVLSTGPNSRPRAIAVDPINRAMFWTDYGITAKIETAAMDGSERRILHFSDLSQPNGITIDYTSERIYWSDAGLDRLEFSGFDGSDRRIVESGTSGLLHPFSVTVADDVLFWSDWATNKVYATHKEHGTLENEGFFSEFASFVDTPYGIEALQGSRQPSATNPCLGSECSHMCLLTFASGNGYTCACPEGYSFENATFCKSDEGPPTPCSTTPGLCAGEYSRCCEGGFCAGTPATCYCDGDCRLRGDCCSDINMTCIMGWPRTPRDISTTDNEDDTVTFTWNIPFIESTPEIYTVEYGTSSDNLEFTAPTVSSGNDTTVTNQEYSTTTEVLNRVTTYYFRVTAENEIGSAASDILQFTTAEGAPSASPNNFEVTVVNTMVCSYWEPLPEDRRNGIIISYTLIYSFNANIIWHTMKGHVQSFCFDLRLENQELSCSVFASTAVGDGPPTDSITITTAGTASGSLPFTQLNATFGVDQVFIPESDDGTFGPIPLPDYGFPFWSSSQTQAYIGINGILSFDQPYGSFFNQAFPGNFFISSRYLVAPFWDDANIAGGRGQISYEIHDSGFLLDHISAFIRSQRPSEFQGTWMLIVFYDAVQPYSGSGENTFQAILITDGTYTYTVYTYDCNLAEWGTSATIGFNAAGERFENNEYTSNAIACSSLPVSNLTNVIYRLSIDDPEYPLPEMLVVDNVQPTSVTIRWVVPSVTEQQQYMVVYGLSPLALDQTSSTVDGSSDITLTDQEYSVDLTELATATQFYFRVAATFSGSTILSELGSFRTQDLPPSGPPANIVVTATGVSAILTWESAPVGTGLLLSYTLSCSVESEDVLTATLKPIETFTLEELFPSTSYTCSLYGSTSGGAGPPASFIISTEDIAVSGVQLPFVLMNAILEVEQTIFPESDEGTNGPIEIDIGSGLPFGSSVQSDVYVGTNGIFSFGTAYGSFSNQPFPGSSAINTRYLVAPFWGDVDTTFGSGEISYEIHRSGYYLNKVNEFLTINRPSSFEGTWMMVTYWDAVHPYFGFFSSQENTFQAILITDGVYSYAIFTYKCGLMQWGTTTTIGYNAAGNSFANHDPSNQDVACLNIPDSDYSNVIYLLSDETPEIPLPQDLTVFDIALDSAVVSWRISMFEVPEQYYVQYGTDPSNLDQTTDPILSPMDTSVVNMTYDTTLQELEPGIIYYFRVAAAFNEIFVRYSEIIQFITLEQEQTSYLQFLPHIFVDDTRLESCDDCTSEEITFPGDFPFGGYYHQSAFVSTNGLISFGTSFTNPDPVLFPSTIGSIASKYIVAPFWADFDTTSDGDVYWWIEESSSSAASVGYVSNFIREQYGDDDFSATWMLVGSWEGIQPSENGNSFQAILITDGSKSYAIYTYKCDELMWSGPATIGVNTPQDISFSHPLSGTPIVDDIDCIHQNSEWKNLIYDLETNPVILPVTPAPSNFLGSCVAAGFTECCQAINCLGQPVSDCYCDDFCFFFGDCCPDIVQTCPSAGSFDILVGHGHHISQVHFEGVYTETVRTNTTGTVVGVDYWDVRSNMFWSDVTTDTIHRANMDGTAEEVLVNTNLIAVDDIAVDWVSGKLYWVDAGWARIEAMDLDSLIRVEVLRTGANTAPRAIAVDPTRRVMYWTDWGRTAKIEVASMDGSERRDFVITDLSQPNGIAIDLSENRVYWSDADLDKLEFINFDGSSRTSVETAATGLTHPFAVSVGNNALFWSDWATNSIYATHKEHGANSIDGNGYFATIASFPSTPYGVEALLPGRQPAVTNPCENNECSHVCLLSEISDFTCACPEGYFLDNATFCKVSGGGVTPTPPPDGTCAEAGYEYCCDEGFCAGYPPTCYCDSDCFLREDCCSDISDTCVEGSPRAPTAITVSSITGTSALIGWTVQYITSTQETYVVTYGLSPDDLTFSSPSVVSGSNDNAVYEQLLSDLDPAETYYFIVTASNDAGTSGSNLYSFMTPVAPPSGPPLNFAVEIDGTAMAFTWVPPQPMLQNGEILSYTLSCAASSTTSVFTTQLQQTIDLFVPGETFQCRVFATNEYGDGPPTEDLAARTENVLAGTIAYLPFLELGLNQVLLPEMDDGESDPIPLPEYGFPFWSTNRSEVYVGTNGLLSFDIGFDSFFNVEFPGFVSDLYLVAVFWDDADTRGEGSGQVSYEIHESGYLLDHVNAFIRRQNPSDFQGTWMMITYWDAINPYYGPSSSEENTYQAILITDGTYTYTVFIYDCNLAEWGTSATIGFNAAGERFENNEYTSNTITCSSLPDSNLTNVIYRLSSENPEFPPPQDVQLSDITLTTVTLSWVVPSFNTLQQYSIAFGEQADDLDQRSGLLFSPTDTSQTNVYYTETVYGLTQGTEYFMRVSSTFGYNVIYSELVSFLTLEPPPDGPPLNFEINVIGTTLDLSWQPPAEELRNGVIRFYTLSCSSEEGGVFFDRVLNNVLGIALDTFEISTSYTCTISASTSGGSGPTTSASATTEVVEDIYLPLIPVGSITDTGYIQLPDEDDATSDPIEIPSFPFGDSFQTTLFVGTNGLLSFNTSYNVFFNSLNFSESTTRYLVAPFWDDVDIQDGNGRIFYESYDSGYFLDQVNTFLRRRRPSSFEGTWMLAAHWDAVHPFTFGFDPRENTFQAILITDGISSYTIFTYKCGLMEWDNGAIIGYSAAGDPYENHDPSSSDVACLNSPTSNYSNVIFLLSNVNQEIPIPASVVVEPTQTNATVYWRIIYFTTQEQYYIQYGTDPNNLDQRTDRIDSVTDTSATDITYSITIVGLNAGTVYYLRVVAVFDVLSKRQSEMVTTWTKEEEQAYYLDFLNHTDNADKLEPCAGCSSSEIVFPYDFPFGGYFHRSAFVSTNGVISFGQPLEATTPEQFPLSFWSYLVAPFWVNINTNQNINTNNTNQTGSVYWELYERSSNPEPLDMVDMLIQQEQGDQAFSSLWILVASWEGVEFTDQPSINTFQAILTTNGVKSYAVFTYKCGQLLWSGAASIGFNAPPTLSYNHPLTLTALAPDMIACSHSESELNNVIIDIQIGNVILPTTPQPAFPGSCRAAGFTECCDGSLSACVGVPIGTPPCFCDSFCVIFGDCCFDADHTCFAPTFDLLVGNGNHLTQVHFEGTVSETVRSSSNGSVVGVDFHAARSLMFWSDTIMHTIHQANMDGTNENILVDSNIRAVDDIAVDWIANNLYWADSVWARIEALNLDNMERAEILRVGANSRPRGIAVDPINRVMFWTDWGQTAKIERASMDGTEGRTVHEVGLSQPNGITIDYSTERIYWSDSDLDKLEYSNYDGSERTVLETQADGLFHPFALTITEDILFWTDWETNTLYYTHKDHGNTEGLGLFESLAHFTSTPYGVEAMDAGRQPAVENPCEESGCSHICLLSATSETGYTCSCAQGAGLQNDEKTCGPTTAPPTDGSCVAAEYTTCCSHGFCAGYPATCGCNPDCYQLGDCCSDINEVCPSGVPLTPTLEVTYLTHVTAVIQWRVASIAFSPEDYTLVYATSPNENPIQTESQFSGTDITLTDQVYSVRLENLSPGTTYYYQLRVINTFGVTDTDMFTFDTPFVGPPQNFMITVEGSETLTFSWDLPLETELGDIQYYVIECEPRFQHAITEIVTDTTATLEEFLPGTTYTCTVAAKADDLGAPAMQTATTEEAPTNLPFLVLGATLGVERETLDASDDANSAPIYITGGLPLGSATHTIAYVGTNGIISFGQEWFFWNPELFPTSDYYIHNSYVIAPFWADIDTRAAGSVFYEVHQRGTNVGSNAVLERVSGFISAELSTSFTGSWMLVAQWDRVHPFPHGAEQSYSEEYGSFLDSENTFQVAVVTDGTRVFSMYTYQCDLMEWSGAGDGLYATIGYNLNGAFLNHPLTGMSQVNTVACLSQSDAGGISRRQVSRWHNELYQLPAAVDLAQQLRSECLLKKNLDIQAVGDVSVISSSLQACPNTRLQAQLDFRFVFHSASSTLTSQCYINAFPTGSTGISSLICCYSRQSSSLGSLLIDGSLGSSIALFHPNHFTDQYTDNDKEFKEKCCLAGLCDVFYERRPIDYSIDYQPPFFAFVNGDPHLTTLDGYTYTFNGRGEYTLVKDLGTGFALQGRTEPVSETSNATQFSAFAMGIKAQDLSAEIRSSRGRLITFVNGDDVSSEIEAVNSTVNMNNTFYLLRSGENAVRVILRHRQSQDSVIVDHVYVLTVTQRGDILDFVVNIPPNAPTRGLFGNFNGDNTDDFIQPNGIQIPSTASDPTIHDFGQSWQITEEENHFTYPTGMSSANYAFPNHIPPFLREVVANAPGNIRNECNGDDRCIFDAVQTGDIEIGTGTMTNIENNDMDVMQANNFPPSFDGLDTFRVNVGQTSTYTFTVTDETDSITVTVQGPETLDSYSLTSDANTYSFSWTVTEIAQMSVTFVATDPMNAVSTHSPRVEICACQYNGTCTLGGVLSTDGNAVIMECECLPAWEGRYCEDEHDGCSDLTCFEGVQCYDISAPGFGAVCGPCPDGYLGDGEKCADVDECNSTTTNNCQQVCLNSPGSFMCACRDGYQTVTDNTTNCEDVNECALETHNCQQVCSNTDGSFTCLCFEGYDLDDDQISCTARAVCEDNSCSHFCAVVNGNPVCSCPRGYTLGSDQQTCADIDECQSGICEQSCANTEGSFECGCNSGFTLSANQRDCEDLNECVEGALSGSLVCSEGEVCQNTVGNFDCVCPEGTTRNDQQDTCEVVTIPKPPVVVIPTDPPTIGKVAKENSVIVTLGISEDEFDSSAQVKFKIIIAEAVTDYCAGNSGECQGRSVLAREAFVITTSDVILADIVNNADNQATFLTYVYVKERSDVLNQKALEAIVNNVLPLLSREFGTVTVAPVVGTGSSSKSGLSDGAAAGIAIVVILIVVAVLSVVAFMLYRWRKTGSYKFGEAPTRTMADVFRSGRSGMAGAFRSGRSGMADIFRPRRSSMLIDDNTYDSESTSMKDTAAAAKDTAAAAKDTAAAAKAREADAEDPFGEEEKGVFVEEKMGAFDEEKGAFGEEKTAEDTV